MSREATETGDRSTARVEQRNDDDLAKEIQQNDSDRRLYLQVSPDAAFSLYIWKNIGAC
jgi:hypothetical protein